MIEVHFRIIIAPLNPLYFPEQRMERYIIILLPLLLVPLNLPNNKNLPLLLLLLFQPPNKELLYPMELNSNPNLLELKSNPNLALIHSH